jgi:hypothetical protein
LRVSRGGVTFLSCATNVHTYNYSDALLFFVAISKVVMGTEKMSVRSTSADWQHETSGPINLDNSNSQLV